MESHNMNSFLSSFLIYHYVCECHLGSCMWPWFVGFIVNIPLFPILHVEGHLGHFQIGAIMNSVAVNILGLVFW